MNEHKMEPLPPNCIPIYYYDKNKKDKDLCIGKIQEKVDKNYFELSKKIPKEKQNIKRQKKEYTLLNKKTKSCQNEYKGQEMVVDSKYVLMTFKPEEKKIEFYPANHWVNFMKIFRFHKCEGYESDEKSEKIIERKNREDHEKKLEFEKILKVGRNNIKTGADPGERKKGRKKQQKKSIMSKNYEKDDNDNNEREVEKLVFGVNGYEEDSHSSEYSFGLEESEDSEKNESEKRKEELEKKNKNNKEEKNKTKKNEDLKECDSDYEDEDDDVLDSYSDNEEYEDLEEKVGNSICNLLNKSNNKMMTFDDIIKGLKNEYPNHMEVIAEILDDILNNKTISFVDNKKGLTYYKLKNTNNK